MAEFTLPNAEQMDRLIETLGKGNASRPVDDPHGSPGPQYIERGTKQAGFYGFVKSSDFGTIDNNEEGKKDFNAENLALALGITQGVPIYQNVSWLKFSWKGKVLLTPMRVIRRSISWDHIYLAGAVFGTGNDVSEGEQFMLDNDKRFIASNERVPQGATVTIDGLQYRVRLMRGSSEPVNRYSNPNRDAQGPENEWNRLILPLHEKAPNNFAYNGYANTPTEDWDINLTDDDLRTHYLLGIGSYSWMQEPSDLIADSDDPENGPVRRVVRGYNGASLLGAGSSIYVSTHYGWRPVLELL